MGTATYFSPEQAQGAQPDPRSDLYSLGIVMYEMVAGRPPFTGDNPVSIAYKQVHDAPAAAQPDRRRRAPARTRRSSPSCWPRTPRSATPTANALRDDLRRFRNGEQVLALAAAAGAARAATRRRPPSIGATTGATVPMRRRPATQRTVAQARRRRSTGSRPAPRRPPATTSRRRRAPGGTRSAAFFALIALGIGGVLLFNALSGDDDAGSNALKNYVGMPLEAAIADLDSSG